MLRIRGIKNDQNCRSGAPVVLLNVFVSGWGEGGAGRGEGGGGDGGRGGGFKLPSR